FHAEYRSAVFYDLASDAALAKGLGAAGLAAILRLGQVSLQIFTTTDTSAAMAGTQVLLSLAFIFAPWLAFLLVLSALLDLLLFTLQRPKGLMGPPRLADVATSRNADLEANDENGEDDESNNLGSAVELKNFTWPSPGGPTFGKPTGDFEVNTCMVCLADLAFTLPAPAMQITARVHSVAGDILELELDEAGQIFSAADLKERVAAAWHVPPSCQKLMVGTSVLTDVSCLSDFYQAEEPVLSVTMVVSLDDVMRDLEHNAAERRQSALEVLVALGPRGGEVAIAAVQGSLENMQSGMRRAALQALVRMLRKDDDRAISAARRLLAEPSVDSRCAALVALAAASERGNARSLEVVRPALRDPEPAVRVAALQSVAALATKGDEGVIDLVCRCLLDPSVVVRRATLQTILVVCDKGDRTAKGCLLGLLQSPSSDVRRAALQALGSIALRGDEEIVLAVLACRDVDPHAGVRRTAVQVLSTVSCEGDSRLGDVACQAPVRQDHETLKARYYKIMEDVSERVTRAPALRWGTDINPFEPDITPLAALQSAATIMESCLRIVHFDQLFLPAFAAFATLAAACPAMPLQGQHNADESESILWECVTCGNTWIRSDCNTCCGSRGSEGVRLWICTCCGEPNKAFRQMCNGCQGKRSVGAEQQQQPDLPARDGPPPFPPPQSPKPPPLYWDCGACGEPNRADRACCNNCRLKRDPPWSCIVCGELNEAARGCCNCWRERHANASSAESRGPADGEQMQNPSHVPVPSSPYRCTSCRPGLSCTDCIRVAAGAPKPSQKPMPRAPQRTGHQFLGSESDGKQDDRRTNRGRDGVRARDERHWQEGWQDGEKWTPRPHEAGGAWKSGGHRGEERWAPGRDESTSGSSGWSWSGGDGHAAGRGGSGKGHGRTSDEEHQKATGRQSSEETCQGGWNESFRYMCVDGIRFTQNSVASQFSCGRIIADTVQELVSGRLRPSDLPPMRVVEALGKMWTLDNRRLRAFQTAFKARSDNNNMSFQVQVKVLDMGNPEVRAEFDRKFTAGQTTTQRRKRAIEQPGMAWSVEEEEEEDEEEEDEEEAYSCQPGGSRSQKFGFVDSCTELQSLLREIEETAAEARRGEAEESFRAARSVAEQVRTRNRGGAGIFSMEAEDHADPPAHHGYQQHQQQQPQQQFGTMHPSNLGPGAADSFQEARAGRQQALGRNRGEADGIFGSAPPLPQPPTRGDRQNIISWG
ncbi:unnamed protein product, partial [Polarella glacialis]